MRRLVAFAAALAFAPIVLGVPASAETSDLTPDGLTVAQAQPIGVQQGSLANPHLVQGLTYTIDTGINFSNGKTGASSSLAGSWDLAVGYGGKNLRAIASLYQLPEYPIGFSSGIVPVYLQGTSSPIGTQNLSVNSATIKNDVFVGQVQFLVQLPYAGAIVISPTYVARWGTVGGHSDDTLVMNPTTNRPQWVHSRTFQYEALAFTLPLVSSPRFFVTYTIAPQWNVQLNGLNVTNHAQLFQLGYVEYKATKAATVYFQPSMLMNYTPTDQYPEHTPTYILGASYRIAKPFYVQAQLTNGTPTNPANKLIGISAVTLQGVPPTNGNTAATINGLKASTIQLMIGIGTPSVIPL
jgi:hypothetical protein